ncbi:hypothetical protein, partial [Sphingopyxis sp.]|uniref:hypothetical protein n=1 Tax=Sphingopyxis sp. TaxID=1908224 RepID=UPI001DC1A294
IINSLFIVGLKLLIGREDTRLVRAQPKSRAAARLAGPREARREAAVGEPIFEENWGYRRPCTTAPPPVMLGLAETSPTLPA